MIYTNKINNGKEHKYHEARYIVSATMRTDL